MTKPTLLVRINYSESRRVNESHLNDGGFHPIAEVNKLFSFVDMSVQAQDGGYDKTDFTVMVWDGSDDDLSEYDGRIDLGDGYSSPKILQQHITQHCEYSLKQSYTPVDTKGEDEVAQYKKELNWWLGIVAA